MGVRFSAPYSFDRGTPVRGLEYGGGDVLNGPWGEATSANMTPDPSGISYYDEVQFIQTNAHRLREGPKIELDHALRRVCEP